MFILIKTIKTTKKYMLDTFPKTALMTKTYKKTMSFKMTGQYKR